MSNRILYSSICTSDSIDQLTDQEECFFYRLLVTVDDFGRADARPKLLARQMYPLRQMRDKTVDDILNNLEKVGLIVRYSVDDKPYLAVTKWADYQRVRNKKSRYPAPSADNCQQLAGNCGQMLTSADNCQQLTALKNQSILSSSSSLSNEYSSSSAREDDVIGEITGMGIHLTPKHFEELRELSDRGMTNELILLALDISVADGALTWNYMRTILNGWVMAGVQSVAQAEAEHISRRAKKAAQKAVQPEQTQRMYTGDADYLLEGVTHD